MPDLRRDPVTGDLVLLAPGRAARPHTVAPASAAPPKACPFCPGHEHETPPEVYRTGPGAPDTPGWRVRVAPNLYPIVGGPDAGEGARGAHEVVVLSPDHGRSFGMLTDDQAVEVVTVMRDRARVHLGAGCAFVQVLINQGRGGGASIAHPHAQVLALEFVPPAVAGLAARFDLDADLLADDRTNGPGLVLTDDSAPAWCPWASPVPYSMRVAPPEPAVSFDRAADPAIAATALVARDALASLRTALDDPAYNLIVHTAPPAGTARPYWFVEIHPRTSVMAGFELGTGVLVNTVMPETAAKNLRAEWPS
jgi:UDPglucose--hexose-1-phosphate uridylyltransferase